MNCENPLRAKFWLGWVDPRPLALFRICFGLAVLQDLYDLAFGLCAFFTDGGMLPRSVPRAWWAWSVFDLVSSGTGVAALFAVAVVAVIAFTVGFQTRVATAVAWTLLVSLHHRNYFVIDGGDQLVAIMFFWSFFADLDGCWSVAAMRRGGPPRPSRAFGLRLLQAHIAMLYFVTARLKILRGWLHGTAIFQALQLEGFVRPFGAWLETHPTLCTLATYSILAMEGLFPFFAFSPFWIKPSRVLAFACGLSIQLGIATAMRVGIFQQAMLASCTLFVMPAWLDRLEPWLRARGIAMPLPVTDETASPPKASEDRWRHLLQTAVAIQFILAVWDFFVGRRFPLPQFIRDERDLIAIVQPGDLFGTTYAIPRWNAPGTRADGSLVEVLSVVAPGTQPRGPGLHFSRWNKFTFKERERPLPWPTLGPYFCREFDRLSPGSPLASFTVIDGHELPHLPYQPTPPSDPVVLWRQVCE
jgi:hypothetical protein